MATLVHKPIFEDLPLVIDKVYRTKFQTGDLFLVKKLISIKFKSGNYSVDKVIRVEGYYVGKEHIGICPLDAERLITDKKEIGTVKNCPSCGIEIND